MTPSSTATATSTSPTSATSATPSSTAPAPRVGCFITIGAGRGAREAPGAVALAHRYDDVVATVGIHPHDAADATPEAIAELEDPRPRPPRWSPRAKWQVLISLRLRPPRRAARGLPRLHRRCEAGEEAPAHHTRTAAAARRSASSARRAPATWAGVIHCFSEDTDFAREALDLDFLDISSTSGIVTFKSARAIQNAGSFRATG